MKICQMNSRLFFNSTYRRTKTFSQRQWVSKQSQDSNFQIPIKCPSNSNNCLLVDPEEIQRKLKLTFNAVEPERCNETHEESDG